MGQGHYTMIGYGVIDPPFPIKGVDDEYWDGWPSLLGIGKLRSSYETEPDYLVIPLAVSCGVLARYWGTKLMCRHACLLHNLADSLKLGKDIQHAEKLWDKVIKKAKKEYGVDMPLGKLILVSDWD